MSLFHQCKEDDDDCENQELYEDDWILRDNATKTKNDNGDDNATAPRVSRLKVVIALLFNHCKEMMKNAFSFVFIKDGFLD